MCWRWLGALGGVGLLLGPAHGFYFPDWPGAMRPPRAAIIRDYAAGDPPSVRDPVTSVPATTPDPDSNEVPEPSSIFLAAAGFAWAGLARRRNRR